MNQSAKVHPGVELFISGYPEEMQERLWYLRSLVMSLPYPVEERMAYGVPFYSYMGDFVSVFVRQKKHTELFFNEGCLLPDPFELLEGKGVVMRYLRISSIENCAEEAVRQLLMDAVAVRIRKKGKYGSIKAKLKTDKGL